MNVNTSKRYDAIGMDLDNLLTTAKVFLTDRVDSLEKDVRYCVIRNEGTTDWPAPFPALLYCFSVIDLLGALYGGEAKKTLGISKRSLNYMIDIMGYPDEISLLIQKIFRHKLVHLAQPMPVQKIKEENYAWRYVHEDQSKHLKLEVVSNNTKQLTISIMTLAKDIKFSVYKLDGYLDRLNKDPDLQRNFKIAYEQIFKN